MKKKIAPLMIIAALAASMAACGGSNGSAGRDSLPTVTPVPIEDILSEIEEKISDSMTDIQTENVSDSGQNEPTPVEVSGFYTSDADALKDIVSQQDGDVRVFFFDASETYEEYQIVCSENGLLTRLMDVCFFSKDYYTEEYLENLNIDDTYPGFSSMSFAEKTFSDSGDFYSVIISFNDLTEADNVKAMSDNGIIIVIGDGSQGINADSYANLLIDSDKIELDPATMQPKE